MRSKKLDILTKIKFCPVCGSKDRILSYGMSVEQGKNLQGRYYLIHIAKMLGKSVENFASDIKIHQCLNCKTYFCDPWIEKSVAKKIFNNYSADHLFAWANFESWLHRYSPQQLLLHNLFELIEKKIGKVEKYAEFGCPFQGFLLHFRGYELTPKARLKTFLNALLKVKDKRWSPMVLIYNYVTNFAGFVYVSLLSFRGFLVYLLGRSKKIGGGMSPANRYLIGKETSIGWGGNCVRFGGTCKYFADTVLSAQNISFDELSELNENAFDLIGCFNIIDHHLDPLSVIKKHLKVSRNVLLVTHKPIYAGKQHLFALGDEFVDYLKKSLPGIKVDNLNLTMKSFDPYNNYILLGKI